jgi:hypothetical protein
LPKENVNALRDALPKTRIIFPDDPYSIP